MSRIVLTCEHASVAVPLGFTLPVVSSHWLSDPGALDITKELARLTKSNFVASKFSRILIDVNRPLSSETLIRKWADGKEIVMNRIGEKERLERIKNYYEPYHAELAKLVSETKPELLLSMHSFTDCYEGMKRDVEIGVLYNTDDSIASLLNAFFKKLGYDSRLNEPWSGKDGYMFSIENASKGNIKNLMVEFRQDLLLQSQWRNKVALQLAIFLKEHGFVNQL